MSSTGNRAARQILDHTEKLAILADLYESQGKYADAEVLYRRIVDIKETALGPDDPELANDLFNLGLLCYAQDKYAEAERLLHKTLSLEEMFFGKDNTELATTLDALAQLYYEQGKYAQAVEACKRALKLCGQRPAGEGVRPGSGLFELAEFMAGQERDDKGDSSHEAAFDGDLMQITAAGTG